MSYLIKCPSKYEKKYESKYRSFPFELDHFQKYACEGIDNDENVFVAVATGSGKTVPAEYAISKALAERNKVVYISPIKALSNQKYKDFSESIEDIGIMTGDNKVNPQANLVIMTAEIFRNSLYRAKWEQETDDNVYSFDPKKVKYVILDEVHYINDKDRGKVWEEILMLLPKDTHLTMLSATIDRPDILATWVGEHQQKNTRLITQYERPVPLKFYLINEDEKVFLMETNKCWRENVWRKFKCKKYQPIYWINHTIKILEKEKRLPSIFFTLSKKQIDIYVNKIVGNFITYEEISQVKKIWNNNLLKYRNEYKSSSQYEELYNLVIRGIAYHHSGIIPILKEIVEILYSKRLIKVLLATETFAVGVNMPTKTVIFTGLSKYDNNGRRMLRTDEFLQMAGRAGRRGLDTYGEVIILPNYLPTEEEFKKIILGKPLYLQSRLKLDYTWVLRNLYNLSNLEKSENKILHLINFAKNSFLEKNAPKQIENIKINIKKLEEDILKLNKIIPKDFEVEYIEIVNSLNNKKINKKKKKIIITRMNYIRNDKNYNNMLNVIKMRENLQRLNSELGVENDKLHIHFELIINYLEKEGFVKNMILTDMGLILKEINEINPLVFSYMAFENKFDKITFPKLVAFLSIFLEVKNNNILISDLDITNGEKELLEIANYICGYYLENECKLANSLPYPLFQDYSLTLEHYDIVKKWCEGKKWVEIKLNYNNFEGNFCKLILRLYNLLKEVKIIFNIIGKDYLVEMINENEDSLIREIVQTESLYLV